ncbi:MAG: hypothetical protein AUJ85_10230 [Elusimicrobia bacterium CG1_02_37_114]|nr:MAG: hypothetical protein AUJ85_10230 [Elusimicrobia bacterium CG1_02_37_114]PIV52429.1 MAG: peptidase M23 [Elusimicrobia bacterium CG02_land_8_20_14_3_00_37_13]PIZ13160.1 MAG: peptidase M23 [Elusimicrobia bacterium CG_4_10_14_0_8_um_filter_37_32]
MKKYYIYIAVGILIIIASIILLRVRHYIISRPIIVISSGTFSTGDTLLGVFTDNNVNAFDGSRVAKTLSKEYDLRKIHSGDVYEIYSSTDNRIVKFIFRPDPIVSYNVKNTSYGYICHKEALPVEKIISCVTGQMQTTLYNAMVSKGFGPETIMSFADIFSWQIDFFTEPRVGDTFKMIIEQYKYKSKIISSGKILAAEYSGRQTSDHKAIYFEYPDGTNDYYYPDGKSLRKIFLHAPLNYRRISSHFSYNRFHPILRYYRPHLGIDYAAPTGTPVVSIGDGTVTFRGWKGGFGNLLTIRHAGGYASMYGHLSKFAKGMSVGRHVRQGEVIGYVGSTGLSTGPHLDFRITKDGSFKNFLKLKFPPSKSVDKKYISDFEKIRDEMLKLLSGNNT